MNDSKSYLKEIAKKNLSIIDNGYYLTESKTKIYLKKDIEFSIENSIYYDSNFQFNLNKNSKYNNTIFVVDKTSAEAAQGLNNPCVLNFASARNPGGGFLSGSKAQEEDLCRKSSLYSSLISISKYYEDNKKCENSIYTDGIIYSPNVIFFRNENFYLLDILYYASVLTCPAPNLSGLKNIFAYEKLYQIYEKRINKILQIMHINGHKNIILGAWGCGVFGNDPAKIAECFKKCLSNFEFTKVVFAIPDANSNNFLVFNKIFKQ